MEKFNFLLICFFYSVSWANLQKPTTIGDTYTKDERERLPQFRERVSDVLTQDYMYEDKYLVRFLRARDLNLDVAENMIRTTFMWRKKFNIDNLTRIDFSKLGLKVNFQLTLDYNNRPGIITEIKDLNIRQVMVNGGINKLRNFVIYGLERGVVNLHLISNYTGIEFIEGYVLFNMAGYNRRNHACIPCIPLWIELAQTYENYYPRLAHKIIVINTPRVFQSIIEAVKPYVSLHTFRKINSYTFDRSEWGPALLKLFPKENLPPQFGGTARPQRVLVNTPQEIAMELLDRNRDATNSSNIP